MRGRPERLRQQRQISTNDSDDPPIAPIAPRDGMWVTLVGFGASWRAFHAYRLIQFRTDATNRTQFGSTKVAFDHTISDIWSEPSIANVIVTAIEDSPLSAVASHINASSPIVFILPKYPTDTTVIENFLINGAHKVPIYFTTDLSGYPFGFAKLRTLKAPPNTLKTKTSLQNIVGVMNGSSAGEDERIILITVPFDTFSAAPTMGVGSNSSGTAITAFLETMRLISKFPMGEEWVLMFAVTDGRFCGFEGLLRLVRSFSSELKEKIEFAVSIDSILSQTIRGKFQKKLRPDSRFFRFVQSFIQSLQTVGIDFAAEFSEIGNQIFAAGSIDSMSIGGEIPVPITDSSPDIQRSDSFAWAFSEALLRTMYDAHPDSFFIDQVRVDTSIWARTIGRIPRVAPFRDQAVGRILAHWMGKFSSVTIDEWISSRCFTPYASTEAILMLYNPAPLTVYLALACAGLAYGVLAFMAIGKHKILGVIEEEG
jgi:hypothetical protein